MPVQEPATHALKRQLGLRDLVPMQILLIVGVTWVGTAAHQGGTHVAFWMLAVVFFYLPSAAVVSFCASIWPEEGGVYQWVRHTFGPFAGFLSGWNFAVWAILTASYIGIQTATSLSYGLGASAAWMGDSHALIVWLTVLIFAAMVLINLPGLSIGRWVSHFGTAVMVLVTLLLIALLVWHPNTSAAHRHISPQHPFELHFPMITILSLNLFTKIAFNSFTGAEQVAVFAGETRNPARSILRSVWIAAPVIVLIYVLSTGSILTYIPAAAVDLTGPIPQVLAAAFGGASAGTGLNPGALLGRFAILALAASTIAQNVVCFAETSRLPLVAGWDHILPQWFTWLHPRWGTPTRSIYVIGALGLAAGLFATSSAGKQEAFQLLQTSGLLSYGVYFILMLAIPLAAGTRFGPRATLTCRAGAAIAIVITFCAMGFGMVPIVAVKSAWLFAAEVFGTGLLVNLVGAGIFWQGTRSTRQAV